ncbi:19517_t:CDS:2 [Funneliformis geosporum]|uniref:18492_t:CDS:1 n=1 Tax=Funneliformis geosporum TaxID=1117311 RepID=A0A9W4SDY5_9GLOM|nr:19517_t:CDS:2 [Funneliformis geosporum]CAI2164817.1 18492_t:CDS:2 [Funneliformis geosporum]
MTSTAVVAGAVLGPIAISGVVAALGIGEAGFVAGSIAASMSLPIGAAAYAAESNPEGLKELENYVSIKNEDKDSKDGCLHVKVIFEMKHQLLDSNMNDKLKSFLRGFELARQVLKDTIKNFEFLVNIDDEKCLEGSNFLHKLLMVTYGNEHVTLEQKTYFLKKDYIFFSRGIVDIILLL